MSVWVDIRLVVLSRLAMCRFGLVVVISHVIAVVTRYSEHGCHHVVKLFNYVNVDALVNIR